MRARMLVLALLITACGAPPARPPTSVIDATPSTVCAGASGTLVALSGRRSSARLSLVPAPPDPSAPPLIFEWMLGGAEHQIVSGDLHGMDLSVSMASDRPLQVVLRVTNDLGGEATTERTISITTADAPSCDGGCAAGTACTDYQGTQACLPMLDCAHAACPACFTCEGSQCVP